MVNFNQNDFKSLNKLFRINLFNSITGIKPANLVGTVNTQSMSNLAIFSSIVHLGSKPPLIGLIVRPSAKVRRHTHENILSQNYYTINHVLVAKIENAHYTSAKFDAQESEFEKCNFSEEWIDTFPAPFVKESPVKFGLHFKQAIPIELNGTHLIIGEIQQLHISDNILMEDGQLNLEQSEVAGISGLNSYYSLKKLSSFPYARPEECPKF